MANKKLYNQTELSKYFGIDRATLRLRLEEAGIEPVKKGTHRELLYEMTPELEAAITPDSKTLYAREKAEKTALERQLKEIELAERRGELVKVKVIKDDLQRMFQKLVQKLETQMPYEIAGALFKAESAEQCQAILRRTVSGIFQDLRKEHEQYLEATK